MGFTKHQRVATKYIDTISYTYSFMHANTVRVSQISQVLFCCTRQHHICDATKRQNAILFSSAYLLQQSVIKKVDFFSIFIKKTLSLSCTIWSVFLCPLFYMLSLPIFILQAVNGAEAFSREFCYTLMCACAWVCSVMTTCCMPFHQHRIGKRSLQFEIHTHIYWPHAFK